MKRASVIGVAVVALLGVAHLALGADKISVLLIDGQNNHKWQETTPVIKKMLEETGRFSVEVLTSPPKAAKGAKPAGPEAWAGFKPDFSKYQVVFSNYNGEPWPAEVNKAFEKYMSEGGGLVIFHAANNSFTNWKEWTQMVGLLWQSAKNGDRITIDDAGKQVRIPAGEGPSASHGPGHPYEVIVRNAEHPVTKGLPAKFMHARDELYHGQRGPGQNMDILATAFSEPQFRGTNAHEPMVWTIPYGKGRVFVSLLGHDANAATDPASTAMLTRGTEWAATGAVTIAPPANLATFTPGK